MISSPPQPNKQPGPTQKQKADQPSDQTPAVLSKFAMNLKLIRDWYQAQQYAGREVGHNVMAEIIITDVTEALNLAIQGKTWLPRK